MSKLVKGVKKVFKKIGRFIKKHWKKIVLAVAIYFTAGVALSYFAPTAGFAASMPGFGAGGIFTKAASFIGLNGPAIAGAAKSAGMTLTAFKATAAAAGMTPQALAAGMSSKTMFIANGVAIDAGGQAIGAAAGDAAVGTQIGVAGTDIGVGAGTGSSTAGSFTMPGKVGAAATEAGGTAANVGSAATSTGTGSLVHAAGPETVAEAATKAGAAGEVTSTAMTGGDQLTATLVKNMNTMNKLAIAKTVVDTASGLLAPSQEELMEKQHSLQFGQLAGIGRDGTGPGMSGAWEAFDQSYSGQNQFQMNAQGDSWNPSSTVPNATAPVGSQYAQMDANQFLNSPYQTQGQRHDAEVRDQANKARGQSEFIGGAHAWS